MTTVLISGAGIAGNTLAYWLARHGFRPTVVERAQAQRSSGSPVDVRGAAVDVVERMGVLPRLRAAGTAVTRLTFVGDDGRRTGGFTLQSPGGRDVELPRADLAGILYEASRDEAEYLYDDSITSLSQDTHNVEVTFERAAPRRFDLVVGADGLHSATRRLAFGPEERFVTHLGLYVATMPLTGIDLDPAEVLMHNAPGRAVTLHPGSGRALAAFLFRAPERPGFDSRDTGQHRRMLDEAFGGGPWRLPELLAQVHTAGDLFLDSVSRVRLDTWSAGRVVLLGDAASCVSLFGDGSSLAITGAETLATSLAAHAGDHEAAFRSYERQHRTLADHKQRRVGLAAGLLVPATRWGITARNLGTRLWSAADTVRQAARPHAA